MKREDFKDVIELPKEFIGKGSVCGAKFSQCFCGDGYYIYKKQLRAENGFENTKYEVFFERVSKSYTVVDGKFITNDEIGKVQYPNDEAFGIWAWDCSNIASIKRILSNKIGIDAKTFDLSLLGTSN